MMASSLDTLQSSFRELPGYDGSMVLSVRGEVIAVSNKTIKSNAHKQYIISSCALYQSISLYTNSTEKSSVFLFTSGKLEARQFIYFCVISLRGAVFNIL